MTTFMQSVKGLKQALAKKCERLARKVRLLLRLLKQRLKRLRSRVVSASNSLLRKN